jgi:hypothetical protein
MTSKYIKIPSLQGVTSINDGQILDFQIPSNGYYNLDNSFLSFMAKIENTESSILDPDLMKGIHSCYAAISNHHSPLRNNFLIGDYKFSSDNVHDIENLQQSNVINCNMDVFSRDYEQILSDSVFSLVGSFPEPTFTMDKDLYSNFRTLNKSSMSTEDVMEVKIPLNSISSFCNTQVFDTNKFGRAQLKVQVKTDSLSLYENVPYPISADYYVSSNVAPLGLNLVVTEPDINKWLINENDYVQIKYQVNGAGLVQVVIKQITAIVKNGNNYTLTMDTPISDDELAADIAFWKVNEIFECDDYDGDVATATFTSTDTYFNDYIQSLKQHIGRPGVIACVDANENGGAVDGYENCTIVDFVPVDGYKEKSKIKITIDKDISKAGQNPVTNIVITFKLQDYLRAEDIAAAIEEREIDTYTINKHINDVKLWVGQKIRLYADTWQDADLPLFSTIKSIASDGDTTTIVLNDELTVPANQAFDGIIFQTVPSTLDYIYNVQGIPAEGRGSLTFTLFNPTMVLHELFPTHRMLKSYMSVSHKTLQYYYWQQEMVNIEPGIKTFVKMFNVDGSVCNLYAILKKSGSLLSDAAGLASYRWRVNNVDRTQRDVAIGNALETDTVIQTINSSNIVALRNLQSLDKEVGFNLKNFSVPMCSLPLDGLSKMVMLTLNFSTEPDENVTLYLAKEAIETINL